MKKSFLAAILAFAASSAFGQLIVPSTSDIWLAGAPNGTHAAVYDVAPNQSPILVAGITAGTAYTFSVTGAVGNGPSYTPLAPDGGAFTSHYSGTQNGISDLVAPINSLVGVFTTSTAPVTPGTTLNFTGNTHFSSLSPTLNQAFFIGDGRNNLSQKQLFFAPQGATRLFLGTMDGFDNYNNIGSFTVAVTPVPEPATYGLIGGLALLGIVLLRRRKA